MAVNTLEEFETLPESLVAEFVDGRIRVFNSFTTAQHEIRNELLAKASQYLKEAGLDACMALLFHANVQIGNDIFEPALFACEKEILTEKRCVGVPDWIVEIATPQTVSWICATKLQKYMDAAVPEYWIVDMEARLVLVYRSSASQTGVEAYSMDKKEDINLLWDAWKAMIALRTI